nr:MAG TPA: hypothetical protein [Caudoviricetes sp.]
MAELIVNKGDRYTVDPLFQWDINQTLEIHGLSLASDPEIHFSTEVLNGAIVRQATRDSKGIITVKIPNSLLQKPYKIDVFVCVYEGETFQSLYKMSIPVNARKRPFDYTLEDTDEEIYSFNELENQLYETLKTLTLTCDNALLDLQKSGAENLVSVNQKADETLARLEQVSGESLTQLTETCEDAVVEINQKYDSSVAEFDRLGTETVKKLTDNFDERVESVRDEIMGDTGVMLEGKINAVDTKLSGLIGVLGTISIAVGSWSNKTYTISSELIRENSIIDVYYNSASKTIIADAEPSYVVSVGKIVINVDTVPVGTVTIDSIKVVNDV